MKAKIEVVSYNQNWPVIFASEARLIKIALGDNCRAIHHVGSTSIPGMCAKPIIDIIPVVKNIQKVDDVVAAMIKLDYQAGGEGGMLFRRFFTKTVAMHGFNVHIYEEGAGEVDRLIKFRDWMRNHQDDADDYANLKIKLASEHADNRLSYTMGKESLVANIDKKTGFSGWRIVQVLTDREWAAYHRIRREEIFDAMGVVYDPHHPTLSDHAHIHLVIYSGADIVGVAQLERLDGGEVALRPFAIDTHYQNRGLGSILLVNIERWLRQQDCHLIKLHASPLAVRFYERHGYSFMPFPADRSFDGVQHVDMGKLL